MPQTQTHPIAPFFNRQGRPITDATWARLLADDGYCRVGVDRLLVQNQVVRVATVWCGWRLGGHDFDPPMLFETSVVGGVFSGAAWLYPTEAEASLGHQVA